jgi:putative molybdopterin biosynthesis protein
VPSTPFLHDVPPDEALATWLGVLEGRRTEAVEVPLEQAPGRVTAAPVWALRSSPAFDASAMDGIAVRAADTLGATEAAPVPVPDFAAVDTGDALPDGYDAVVMREHIHWDGEVPAVRSAVAPWQHVRTIGEDVSATELLLPEGHRLRPVDVAAAAAAGHTALTVRRAPRVRVIPTGDEVRPVGE